MKTSIYIVNLRHYNIGNVIGEEITLPIDPKKLDKIEKKLLSFGGEELLVIDSPKEYKLSDYDGMREVRELNDLLIYAEKNLSIDEAIAILNYDLSITPADVIDYIENCKIVTIQAEDDFEFVKYLVENNLIENSEEIRSILSNSSTSHYLCCENISTDFQINNAVTVWNDYYIYPTF